MTLPTPSPLTIIINGQAVALTDGKLDIEPDTTVTHSLDLSGLPLTALPNGLTVQGSLYLNNTRLETVPSGLTVEVDLVIHGHATHTIGRNVTVGRHMVLSHTQVSDLALAGPITIGGDLYAYHSIIRAIPHGVTLAGQAYGLA